jgi:hypothetical protein
MTKPTTPKPQIDSGKVRALMLVTGLSNEGVKKLIRTGAKPHNFLIREAWVKEIARQERQAKRAVAHV